MKSSCLSRVSPSSGCRTQFRHKAVALGVAMAIASQAYANPTGMSVVAGQATSQTVGNLMQITNTPGAILNWQQFNIDAGQTTQFIQQNAGSQVFNRVTGGDVSQILGTLQSNGQVFLINPAGVFFGQGAVVDTAGFLASTLAASDTDLLNGHLRFNDQNGNAGGIVNQGNLTTHSGGSIVLLAPSIENSGIVHAEGEVLLAAGHSVTIVDMNHPTIGLTVAVKEGDKAVNLGQLIGNNVSLFSHLVQNSGVVEATGAQLDEGGVIRFIAQGDALLGGQVLAKSETGKGGKIAVTGERVAVLDGAQVSADGATGGGTVHLGGGWQGQDEYLSNAQQTVVQANTHVSANATELGNGGEVVVWADNYAAVNAEIQAKGGLQGGNGGRVETSGKEVLAVNVAANTSAPKGTAGQWLIDPANLTVIDQIPAGGFNLEDSSSSPFFSTDDISSTFSPTESYLLNSTVVSGLESNGFVQIVTTGTQPGDGNLTIAAPVLINQNSSESVGFNPELFLEAKGSINITAPVGLMPGQTVFDGFDLFLSYDIAKPVYVNAPLYLGDLGILSLAPYDIGTALPMNAVGSLPLDGVNFLSGMNNNTGSSGPLGLNKIAVAEAVAINPMTEAPLLVGPGSSLKLNVLGASLSVNEISTTASQSVPEIDIQVSSGDLQYNQLLARSLAVEAGSTVSTFSIAQPLSSVDIRPNTSLDQLVSSGTISFNGGFSSISVIEANGGSINFGLPGGTAFGSGFHQVGNITALSGSTINLAGTFLNYEKATLNGAFNLSSGELGENAFLSAIDTDLNGTLNIEAGSNRADFQALGMGSNSTLTVGAGALLNLGSTTFSSTQAPAVEAKALGAYISSSNGQFVAQEGSRIVLDGAASANTPVFQGLQESVVSSVSGTNGATLDITGLDGRLDAPVSIESNGYFNQIQSASQNFAAQPNMSGMPENILSLVIENADIQVNAGGAGKALLIGQAPDSSSFSFGNFVPTVGLDFNGNLNVNSGSVELKGATVSVTNGSLSVNGENASLALSGQFTSADLYSINRVNGGKLAAEGFWDNSAVNAMNAASSAPLAKGNIGVNNDLTIFGGLLSSGGTNSTLNVASDGFLELSNTELSTTVNLAPTATLLFGAQDKAGATTAPVVLNNANINMGGDSLLIVETDSEGSASLNGSATISSGQQGNLILAGRRVFDSNATEAAPDAMTLNIGSGIRLNVTGDASSSPDSIALFYSEQNILTPPSRPVFLLGQLTPEAVAVAEYDQLGFFNGETSQFGNPTTTVLQGFEGPSFVVDGISDAVSGIGVDCVSDGFCVKFDVAQSMTYSGMISTNLNAASLLDSGVAFVEGANLNGLRFQVQTPDQIRFIQGLNVVTAADLLSGKSVINAVGSTVRLGANEGNENLSNNFENNGLLELQGTYTLSGLFGGSGVLNNTGNVMLTNTSGSTISNTVLNSGTIVSNGVYNFAGLIDGSGSLINNGTMNITGTGLIGNQVNNTGLVNLSAGAGQFVQFSQVFNNSGALNLGGGQLEFQGGYAQSAGSFNLQPGSSLVGDINITGGNLSGFGTINGDLSIQGARLIPGASPGLMTVNGDLNLGSTSVVDIEVQGNGGVQGVDFDCIVVSGTANLDGQLNLIDISGGTLAIESQYAFLEANAINGDFAAISYAPASSAYMFSPPQLGSANQVQQLSTSVFGVVPPIPVQPVITESTGSMDSVVNQNLTQAFFPSQTQPDSTSQPTTDQQQSEALEIANQSGTTVSQQSQEIELRATQSNPQRASAVCK